MRGRDVLVWWCGAARGATVAYILAILGAGVVIIVEIVIADITHGV